MNQAMIAKMKEDLLKAIQEKDYPKIVELKTLLNVSNEQAEKYFSRNLTGFPSVDKVWLEKYRSDAEEIMSKIPVDKTVWDVIEQKILEYYDIPVLNYFGNIFKREDFRERCYTWARTFRAMGVEPDEIVPIYGPFVPDIAAMVFALNMIGATPYFLKLAMSPKALEEETREAKIAVVYDGMWKNVADEFSKDKFKNIVVASITEDMPNPKKQIVSFLSMVNSMKEHSKIPNDKKYIWIDKAKQIGDYYTGDVKVPFKPGRTSFITSSSGTTVGGVVKGVMATNESVISQFYMGDASDVQFFPGHTVLNHFPPTASTSMNTLFLLPLYRGMTIYMDPRVSENDFYNQINQYKPNIAVNTGSMWEAFFNRIEAEMKRGKTFDFSCAEAWVVGGEGTDAKKMIHWNEIMKACNNERGMASGYGTSELFASSNAEKPDARSPLDKVVTGVGLPYAGLIEGVFDENGHELSYNQRGNLWIKGPSLFKGYYGKEELTAKSTEDGWFKTGDLAEIDENGFVFVYGRNTDSITLDDGTVAKQNADGSLDFLGDKTNMLTLNGHNIFLFDVSFKIKETGLVTDAIVLNMPTSDNKFNLVAHVVWDRNIENFNEMEAMEKINEKIKQEYGDLISISGYKVYDKMLPYSPTTLKKDKNKMVSETEGYIQVIDKRVANISYQTQADGELKQLIK